MTENHQSEMTEKHGRYRSYCILLLLLSFIAVIRFRLMGVPLEHDEGEYAYLGQLLLKGIPPYHQAYSMKLPGIFGMYAAIMWIFGQTAVGIHAGLLVANLASITLLFLLARKFFDPWTGLVASASFAVLSLGPEVMGVFGHATHFLVLFALAGILLLTWFLEKGGKGTLFLAGLFLGLSFTMKQHAIFLVFFPILYLFWRETFEKKGDPRGLIASVSLFSGGAALPYAAWCLYLHLAGVFEKFWFWTFEYPREYVSYLSFAEGVLVFMIRIQKVSHSSWPLWCLGVIGLVLLFAGAEGKPVRMFMAGFFFFSFLAICPGFYFRPHYFITLLPALSLLIALTMKNFRHFLARRISTAASWVISSLLFLSVTGLYLYQERKFFFYATPRQACDMVYGSDFPFVQSIDIARYIREHTSAEDRIAVLGSEPQLYFYSGRLSATGHIYMYSLMEEQKYAQGMQEELIREIEAAKPEYLIFINLYSSWAPTNSIRMVFDWAKRFARDSYEQTAFVDIGGSLKLFKGRDAISTTDPDKAVYIFRRKKT